MHMKETDMVKIIKELQFKLMADEKLSIIHAAIMADNVLNRFDPRVREGAFLWLQNQLTDSFQVEEITLGDVQEELNVSSFQALCIMDIYLKNPDFIPRAEWFLKGAWRE